MESSPDERQTVIDRIVAISVKVIVEQGGRRIESGSGVVVASEPGRLGGEPVSYVLTAAHILDGKDHAKVFIRFSGVNASAGKLAATVSRRGNPDMLDLALLRVPGIAVPPVFLAEDAQVRLGEEILVVGFPWGKRLGVFSGIVSQVPVESKEDITSDEGTDQTIMVDAATAKGVSGGGVFLATTGALLGVVEGYQTASIAVKGQSQIYSVKVPMPGETFVVPIGRIRQFLGDAELGGRHRWPGKGENLPE
jgi:S1-C subfamily serine protease